VRKIAPAIALIAFLPAAALAENQEIQLRTGVDWEHGSLTLEMTLPLELDGSLFPRARGAAERKIEDACGDIFLASFSALTYSSNASVGEYLAETGRPDGRKAYLANLRELAGRGIKTASVVSPDFRALTVIYIYPFYGTDGVVTPLFTQTRPQPLPEFPGYYATRAFTGLVIYARGDLQAFGKNTIVRCRPALMSRIFYLSEQQTIEPVLTAGMVEPAVLKARGMLAYARSAEPAAYSERAGDRPLTVTAYAVYGTNDTDIVISQDAARLLLSSEDNRRLLREGRVVVIID
jgi:hypothetical protein